MVLYPSMPGKVPDVNVFLIIFKKTYASELITALVMGEKMQGLSAK
jgi:hypothetical protein